MRTLHIWTIDKKQEDHEVPQNMIKQQFHIERATIQIETLKIKHNEMIV